MTIITTHVSVLSISRMSQESYKIDLDLVQVTYSQLPLSEEPWAPSFARNSRQPSKVYECGVSPFRIPRGGASSMFIAPKT